MPEDNDFSFDIFDLDGDGKLDAAETQLLHDHLEEGEENYAAGHRIRTSGSGAARKSRAPGEQIPKNVSRREYEDKKLEFVKYCIIGIVILLIAGAICGALIYVLLSLLDFKSAAFSALLLGIVIAIGALFAIIACGTVSSLKDLRSTLKKYEKAYKRSAFREKKD